MPDDPIVQMAADPDFPKMPVEEQRKALAAHDPGFGQMGDTDISSFVSAHQQNLVTGQGMEAHAQQQARQVLTGTGLQGNYDRGRKISGPNGEPLTYMEKAAQAQSDQQTRLGAAQNRAAHSPTPFTTAAMAYSPVAAAKGIAGSEVGSRVGGAVAPKIFKSSPDAEQYGQLVGGVVGGGVASLPSRSTVAKTVYDPVTGKVKTPWELAVNKLIPDPYAPESVPARPIAKGTNFGQYLEDQNSAYQDNQRFDKQAATAARAAARNVPKPAPTPFAEAESAEGVPGNLPKPSGRLIKLPQEFAAEDQLQGIAKTRASQRGMQFAAGMTPGEGRSIPRTPTATNTVEFPPRPLPWETQGPSAQPGAARVSPQFTGGGINMKGVEASNIQMSPEDTMTSLSTEIGRMKTSMRNSAGRPTSELADMQNQINEYQQRLDELRGPARRLPWEKSN